MNGWMAEELAQLAYAEWQRALEADHLLVDFSITKTHLTFTSRAVLKLSDWLIATGKSLRRRHEKASSVSPWAYSRKFAR